MSNTRIFARKTATKVLTDAEIAAVAGGFEAEQTISGGKTYSNRCNSDGCMGPREHDDND